MERNQILAVVVVVIIVGAAGAYFFLAPPPAFRLEQSFINEGIGEPEYLDPHKDYETGGGAVIQQVYETLFTYPFNSSSTTPSQPLLATALDVSDDGLNYTFTLRQGVRFHDGTPFNASCVQYNMWRMMGRGWDSGWGPPWMIADWVDGAAAVEAAVYEYGDGSAQHLGNFTAWVDSGRGVEVIDTYTVRIILHSPYAAFLPAYTYAVGSMMSPTWAELHGGMLPGADTTYVDDHMCGTGPYEFVEWVLGDKVVIKLNDDYWREDIALAEWPMAGSLTNITFKLNEDTNSRILNLRAGEVDAVGWPTTHSDQLWNPASGREPFWDGIGQSLDPNIKLWAGYPGFGVTFMGYNTHDTMDEPPSNNTIQNPFAILSFRECMSWAFDWDAFLLAAVNGWGKQMQGVIPFGMFGHVDDLPLYHYNLTAAVEKWNEAMTYDLADRFLNASDKLTLWFNTGNPVRETVCLQMKDGLTAVMADPAATPLPDSRTLTIDVQSYAWPTYLYYMRQSVLANFMIGWLPDYADPDNYVGPFLKGTGTFGMRIGMNHDPNGYNHTMVDEWINEAASELDPDVRAQIYSDIEHEVNKYTCFLYVYQPTSFITIRAEVNGYWWNPMFSGRYYYYMWKTEATT